MPLRTYKSVTDIEQRRTLRQLINESCQMLQKISRSLLLVIYLNWITRTYILIYIIYNMVIRMSFTWTIEWLKCSSNFYWVCILKEVWFFFHEYLLTTRKIKLSATSIYIIGTDLDYICDNIIIYKRLKEIRIADIHHLFDLIIDFGNLFICLIV